MKTKFLALGGLMTALSVIFIYLSSIMPTSRLYLLAIASFIIPVLIVISNIKYALISYFSTSIISLLILGFRFNLIIYVVFFGAYGFIKYLAEKIHIMPLEYLIKFTFFNISLYAIYLLLGYFYISLPNLKLPYYLAIIMLQVIFLFYDYFLTIFISYVNTRLKGLIKY